jgi:hypothetical protein
MLGAIDATHNAKSQRARIPSVPVLFFSRRLSEAAHGDDDVFSRDWGFSLNENRTIEKRLQTLIDAIDAP